ncbi:DUF3300 domain-containing protein [Janthinobacterium psychrotolerans]|uniref:DUF3300 domain-containing protein n=1 Tax=Janthinobacterium psychrotolerans TaxID=1747903 RepID=A0A1A7BTX5_9BURK|nr:DUF3300 domain-containing protein [Janthinobacterium psychrotolerans]OBV36957.1 Protein of unknown function (DUF3300) [Janthinobacterium psychrotolerans]
MDVHARRFRTAVSSSLILSLLVLAGCNKPAGAPAQTGAVAATPPQPPQPSPPAPYTPPSADQLAQMVAPIALFPDKLVGQVLAGATYPEQIAAANQWLVQNPSLKGAALQTAETDQPWDVSVKSLTTFPTVLGQMANNLQWTTALGTAYVNDPMDVMNAIQLLRSRARQSGNLKTSQQLRVSTVVRPSEPAYATRGASYPPVYDGPAVIAPPPQTIVIEPAAPDIVYVPHYNPTVVYGAPMPVYPGWVDQRPAYSTETLVTAGALSFGIGILVGAAVSHHHDPVWSAWGVNWGGPAPYPGYGGGWRRPAVVYNNATYVSKSVTVVNHVNNINVTNNNEHYRTVNNISSVADRSQRLAVHAIAPRAPAMMSMPHFAARDTVAGARPLPVAAAQPVRLAAAPQTHAVAAPPRNALMQPMVRHDFQQPQHQHQHQQPQQPQMERQHADAVAQHMAQERASAPVPAPLARHENDTGHGRPQRNHQDMLAVHAAPARPAPPHADHHAQKHEQSAHHHQDHEPHEPHDRHG